MTIGIVNLNLNMERIYRVTGFKPGGVFRAESVFVQAGGKGVNAAKVLKTLGERPQLLGCLGGCIGAWIRKDLRSARIGIEAVNVRGESRVCIVENDPRRKTQTVVNEPGPVLERREVQNVQGRLKDFCRGKKAVLFTGSVLPGMTPADYAGMVRSAKKAGAVTLVDIGGDFLAAALTACPDIVKVNETEWEQAGGAVRKALARGVRWVIITRGKRGATFFAEGRKWDVRVPKIRAKNTVGCGDAFGAGFVHALVHSWPAERAVRFASAVSVAHALSDVPGKVRLADIRRLEPKILIR